MTVLFHGGARDLNPGDLILPPSRTGVEPTAACAAEAGLDATIVRTDRIFVTPHYEAAWMFAGGAAWRWPEEEGVGGDVYAVLADDLEPDPDWSGEEGGSLQAPSAVVVRVVERRVNIADVSRAGLL